uniref:Uncharacterized protein MANES_18G092500 n=1 Tax=Rhizophora mucronata TaxID=61149 RepID=A0A2P2NM61_RHIMU
MWLNGSPICPASAPTNCFHFRGCGSSLTRSFVARRSFEYFFLIIGRLLTDRRWTAWCTTSMSEA